MIIKAKSWFNEYIDKIYNNNDNDELKTYDRWKIQIK
jgi:hypothetical protein